MPTPQLKIEGAIASITLNRPERANRLEPEDLAVIADHLATVNANPDVRVLLLKGEGKYFCSGYDINAMGQARKVNFEEVVNAWENARPVTVSAIHGSVYGGATDFALASDFRVGAQGIEMFMPAARLGLHFYQTGMERYVTRLGLDNAKRLFLTSETVKADEMRTMGFLTHLVSPEAFNDTVDKLCATVASMAPIPVAGMKKHLNRIARGTLDVEDLKRDIARSVESNDLKEGQKAWAEKRVPKFTGT